MKGDLKYLLFGLVVIASYWFTVKNGIVYWDTDSAPAAAAVRTGTAVRTHPTFWGGGFQGGK